RSSDFWVRRFFVLARPSGAPGSGGFEPVASACRLPIGGSVAAPSTPSSGVPARGTPRCSSVSAAAGVGRPVRSPSADKPDSGDGEPAAGTSWSRKCREFLEFLGCLDFWEELKNLYQGPWEWLLPEAQASKGTTCVPLRGTLYAQ